MSLELGWIIFILVGGLFLLLALGLEVAVTMGVLGSLGLLLFVGQPQVNTAWNAWAHLNSFALMAMPLFIFMGSIFANTGVVRSLFDGADKWIGGLRGGLVHSVILANAAFGAMSGSSIAAAATFSLISFPEMEKRGYDPKLAFGSIAIAGTLSVLIPPSIILIVYGAWESLSIPALFAAALIPGLMLTILLMLTVVLLVTINPSRVPKPVKFSWRERLVSIKDLLPWLGVIGLVLGVIFGGVMTATEAAALGAFLSIAVALVYRQMSYHALKASLLSAVKITAMIGFVVFTAKTLSFVFHAAGIIEVSRTFMIGLPFDKYGILAIFLVMYLILGCFFDAFSILVLTLPFVMPVITALGFNPIWFGVIYVITAEIALITPPFGLHLFVIHGIFPRYSIWTIVLGSLPFMVPMLLLIVILIVFPDLVLWLPGILY